MLEFLSEYGLFLAKSVTIVLAILFVVGGIVAAGHKGKRDQEDGHIEVKHQNERYEMMSDLLKEAVLDDQALKADRKQKKKKLKEDKKNTKGKGSKEKPEKRIYVLDFEGDIKASAAGKLTQEINALLTIATSDDEVVINLESMGGMVHAYGLAASQLKRITDQSIPLTVCVDKVAASGGYMMACIADKILAAPFAIIGSIGVMAEVPNFHRLLKKHDVDFEVLTAGEHKRTLTMFGQNTDKGREKFMEELQETHDLFKSFISENRPQVNIDQVATGEVWYGSKALENNLVDGVQTLDAYLMANRNDAEIYEVAFVEKKSLQEKLGLAAHTALDKTLLRWWERAQHNRFI